MRSKVRAKTKRRKNGMRLGCCAPLAVLFAMAPAISDGFSTSDEYRGVEPPLIAQSRLTSPRSEVFCLVLFCCCEVEAVLNGVRTRAGGKEQGGRAESQVREQLRRVELQMDCHHIDQSPHQAGAENLRCQGLEQGDCWR
jgi:hypothetical protein